MSNSGQRIRSCAVRIQHMRTRVVAAKPPRSIFFQANRGNRSELLTLLDLVQTCSGAFTEWCGKNCGPFTQLNIVNLASGENTQLTYQDFLDAEDRGGHDAVMRVGSVSVELQRKIAKELLRIAKIIAFAE